MIGKINKKVLAYVGIYAFIFIIIPTINYFFGTDYLFGPVLGVQLLFIYGFALFMLIAYVLFTKVFKVHKTGDLPWYGSPILWLGIPTLGVIFYGLLG